MSQIFTKYMGSSSQKLTTLGTTFLTIILDMDITVDLVVGNSSVSTAFESVILCHRHVFIRSTFLNMGIIQCVNQTHVTHSL